jgi:o-succinylbenzoate synthase
MLMCRKFNVRGVYRPVPPAGKPADACYYRQSRLRAGEGSSAPRTPDPVAAYFVRIDHLEIRLLRLPLVRHFETSFGRSYDRHFVLVRVDGAGVSGWGESVAEQNPYYSAETTETVWHIVTEFLAPLVLGVEFAHPRDVFPALSRVRGHLMAKAAVEMAAWDLFARQQRLPLWQLLGGSGGPVASGVSIGIQDGLDELIERVRIERDAGYQRIKIKIKPGWDVDAVERVRDAFGGIPLMVDANAAYTLDDATRLARLDAYDLMMIEQPLDYDDLSDHAVLQRQLRTPVCLDESITSARLAAQAIESGACRIINIKPGRLGGFGESIRVHDACAAQSVPVWHGGMLESGIGRAANLHLSTLPNFSLPGDIAASRRYYEPDLIDPPVDILSDGTVPVPADGPGLGVRIVPERVDRATLRRREMPQP